MKKTEKTLVDEFAKKHKEDLLKLVLGKKKHRYALLEEFNSHYGIADIVLAVIKPYTHLPKNRPMINFNWIKLLANLSKNSNFTLSEYASANGISVSTARKHLNCFKDASFIIKLVNNSYRVKKVYQPMVQMSIAIEAKLYDWKKALQQAYRYKRFANYAFVLMPTENISNAIQNISMFRKYNIGLISIGDHRLEKHFLPNIMSTKLNEASLHINELVYNKIINS